MIALHTHIGYGSPKADTYGAHGEPLGEENVKKTKEKLGWPTEPPFFVPDDVLAWWRDLGGRGPKAQSDWQKTFDGWKAANAQLAARFERTHAGKLPDIAWPTFNAENGSVATRDAGGTVMNAIAAALPELVGGSADLDPSTKTYLNGFGDFEPGSFAGRNIHFGVREHAMGAIVNGLAVYGGLLPFGATFFNFLDYMKPAVRLAALSKLHAIFVFTHDSVFLGEDGPTHQPIEQLAILRAQPNTITLRPADSLETLEAWKIAVEHKDCPIVLVLSRQKLPFLGERKADVKRGAYILQYANGTPDVILIATGSEVSLAIDAAKLLTARRHEDARRFDAVVGALPRSRSGLPRFRSPARRQSARLDRSRVADGLELLDRRSRHRHRNRSLRNVGPGRRDRESVRIHSRQGRGSGFLVAGKSLRETEQRSWQIKYRPSPPTDRASGSTTSVATCSRPASCIA